MPFIEHKQRLHIIILAIVMIGGVSVAAYQRSYIADALQLLEDFQTLEPTLDEKMIKISQEVGELQDLLVVETTHTTDTVSFVLEIEQERDSLIERNNTLAQDISTDTFRTDYNDIVDTLNELQNDPKIKTLDTQMFAFRKMMLSLGLVGLEVIRDINLPERINIHWEGEVPENSEIYFWKGGECKQPGKGYGIDDLMVKFDASGSVFVLSEDDRLLYSCGPPDLPIPIEACISELSVEEDYCVQMWQDFYGNKPLSHPAPIWNDPPGG